MNYIDYLVIILYFVGIVGVGMLFSGKMKNSSEMFAAGGQSPWWVSGLSSFMTMFSAGTFVIWGGVAYRYGFVAIVINLCYGVAALMVGWTLAGVWRKAGVSSASEFLGLRFGASIVQFYTWFKGTLTLFSTGGAVYAFSKIACALMPLPAGHPFADVTTGCMSVPIASLIVCVVVIVIALVGGLWAVLMTDVLQFVILTVSVVFVVPLILIHVGGFESFLAKAPAGFMSPVAADFSWWFIAGWMTVNFFVMGGDWAFVQRYVCVPRVKDAKKSAYLVGILYLVSPIFWMLPPLVYRTINPHADTEQAYILACQLVLPTGMMGIMVAAMASATMSTASTRINVYAGAFVSEVYQRIINKTASETRLVVVGRYITALLGIVLIAGAMLIPRYGYTSWIVDINTMLYVPLLLPTVWGLFSRKIGLRAAWVTTIAGFATSFLVKFALARNGMLSGFELLQPLISWISDNSRIADILAGIVSPIIILTALELIEKKEYPGWERAMNARRTFHETPDPEPPTLPGKMVAVSLAAIGVMMILLAVIDRNDRGLILIFAVTLLSVAAVIHSCMIRMKRASSLGFATRERDRDDERLQTKKVQKRSTPKTGEGYEK